MANLVPDLKPLRWMSPGLALMGLMVIYPILFTLYVSLTNYGDGHLFTKTQAIEILTTQRAYQYIPEDANQFDWELYRNDDGNYALWLSTDEGLTRFATATTIEDVVPGESGEAPYDDDGLPETIQGYTRQERAERVRALATLENAGFGPEEASIAIVGRNTAAQFVSRYQWLPDENTMLDAQADVRYSANDEIGNFTALDGRVLDVGYWVTLGLTNFQRFLTSPAISGPLLQIFIWTVMFAILSTLTTFGLGLFFALMLDTYLPGKRIFRTLLIIPYAIPALISVGIWRGMFNENFGIIPQVIEGVFRFVTIVLRRSELGQVRHHPDQPVAGLPVLYAGVQRRAVVDPVGYVRGSQGRWGKCLAAVHIADDAVAAGCSRAVAHRDVHV